VKREWGGGQVHPAEKKQQQRMMRKIERSSMVNPEEKKPTQ